jgi:hypothetical protein
MSSTFRLDLSFQDTVHHLEIEEGTLACQLPPLVCEQAGLTYEPSYGLWKSDRVRAGWIDPSEPLTSRFYSRKRVEMKIAKQPKYQSGFRPPEVPERPASASVSSVNLPTSMAHRIVTFRGRRSSIEIDPNRLVGSLASRLSGSVWGTFVVLNGLREAVPDTAVIGSLDRTEFEIEETESVEIQVRLAGAQPRKVRVKADMPMATLGGWVEASLRGWATGPVGEYNAFVWDRSRLTEPMMESDSLVRDCGLHERDGAFQNVVLFQRKSEIN